MTKYILHGGRTSDSNPDNEYFFKEITAGLKGRIKILLNYFTRDENEWEQLASQDNESILNQSVNKNISFVISNTDNFNQELANSHVLLFRGGEKIPLLLEKLRQSDFEKLHRGKVVAGASAFVYVLSKYYYNSRKDTVVDGLGILNIKSICHYSNKIANRITKLKKHKEDIEILALPEHKTTILFK